MRLCVSVTGTIKCRFVFHDIESPEEKARLLNSIKDEINALLDRMEFTDASDGSLIIDTNIDTEVFRNDDVLCKQIRMFLDVIFMRGDLKFETEDADSYITINKEEGRLTYRYI